MDVLDAQGNYYGDSSEFAPDQNLTASTGKNDPNSLWGSNLLGTLGTTASGLITSLSNNNKPKTTTNPLAKYLPYILGGVALLVVAALVFRRK